LCSNLAHRARGDDALPLSPPPPWTDSKPGGRSSRPVKQAVTAVSYVAGYRTAVAACESVTYSIPGAGSSTLHARRISFDPVGDASFAARFSATSGDLDGFDVIQVEVATRDIVVGLSFYTMDPTDAADATAAALDKAQGVLGTSSSNG